MIKKVFITALLLITGFVLFAQEAVDEIEESQTIVGGSIGLKNFVFYPDIAGSININDFEINLSVFPFLYGFVGGLSFGYNSNAHNKGWSHSIGGGCYYLPLIETAKGSSEVAEEISSYTGQTTFGLVSVWGGYYRLGYRFSSNVMLFGQIHMPLLVGLTDPIAVEPVFAEPYVFGLLTLMSCQIGIRYCFN